MTRRLDKTDPLPPSDDAAEIDIQPGYTPDVFKAKGAQSKGEAAAAYEAQPHAPRKGEDTQKLQPAVVIDQTKEEGFSGDEIRRIVKEMELEEQRGRKTVQVQSSTRLPLGRNGRNGLIVLLALVVGAVLFVVYERTGDSGSTSPQPTASTSAVTSASSPSAVSPTVTPTDTAVSTSPSGSSASSASTLSPTVTAVLHATSTSVSSAHASPSAKPSSSPPAAPSSTHHATDVPSGAL